MIANSESTMLRLLIVASDRQVASDLRASLQNEFHVELASDAPKEFALMPSVPPHDVIMILRDTIDATYLGALQQSLRAHPVPVVMFVQQDPEKLAASAIRAGVTSYIVAGFEANRVPTLLELTIERFKLQQALQDELLKSKEELAARKSIDRAKGLLMDRKDMSEEDAYRALREMAMRQAKPIREVAETLLTYSELLP